uniref:non-ribosomal peptide synthetase n=1 Tax=Paenibacillus wulumuqiensis TaxID=1567107 RepID=UPI0006199505
YVHQVKEKCLGAYAHQEVSFERVVEAVQPERQRSYHPLFQVMFIHHHDLSKNDTDFIQGAEVAGVNGHPDQAKFDLTLSVYEHAQGMDIQLRYRTELLTARQVDRLANHLIHLLYEISIDSNVQVGSLNLLPPAELRTWISEQSDYSLQETPITNSIYDQVELQMNHSPSAIALEYGGESLSYGALKTRVEQLAFHLTQIQAVRRQDRVGIYMDKSMDAVIAILAVVKLGGCIVPVDTTYPQQRQQYMAAHAAPCCMLTTQLLREQAEAAFEMPVIVAEANVYNSCPAGIQTQAASSDAAYIVYTSGSTGRPKAIINHHRGIVNYISFMKKELKIGTDDTVLQLASLSVDGFFRDLIAPLALGARVVLMSYEQARDHDWVIRMIARRQITCLLSTVPSLLKSLAIHAEHARLKLHSMRIMMCSGEVLSDHLALRIKPLFPQSDLINLYGPTETTLTTTYRRMGEEPEAVYDVGKPIDHTAVYILDHNRLPVPDGLVGEVYIGGHGMTRGYFNDEQQTAQHFVQLPWADPALVFYRTGDRGFIRENGHLALKGRLDRQVKVRGYRVELNEVESALESHPAVHTAIAVMRQDSDQHAELEGFILKSADCSGYDLDEIVSDLKSVFPMHLIPSAMFVLQSIPMTPNGKIDRKQLKQYILPPVAAAENDTGDMDTLDIRQQRLVGIWEEVLQYDGIRIRDNFFTIGGHSLLAAQVISRIREQFEVDIPLTALFDYPSIFELDKHFDKIAQPRILQSAIGRRTRNFNSDFTNSNKR